MDCNKYISFVNNIINSPLGIELEKYKCFERQLNKIIYRSQDPCLNVALIGDFSSGKSTYINALLGINALKAGWLATTAVPTKIYKSPNNTLSIIAEDTGGNKYSLSDCAQRLGLEKKLNAKLPHNQQECIDFLTTSNENARLLKCIELYINSMQLDNKTCIIDTPGVNPGAKENARHVAITRDVLREQADAAIVLFPSAAVYKKTFSQFLTENASHFLDNAIFVVTMLDIVSEYERGGIVEFIKENLKSQFNLKNPVVYGVSAKLAVEPPTQSNEYWRDGFMQMQTEIFSRLKQARDKIISAQLTRLLNQLFEDLNAAINSSTKKINETLAVLEKNSVENLKRDIQQCLNKYDLDFRYKQLGAKTSVLDMYANIIDNTKNNISKGVSNCDKIYGCEYGSIAYYMDNQLKRELGGIKTKIASAIQEEAIIPLSAITAGFFDEANTILKTYNTGLGKMYASTSLYRDSAYKGLPPPPEIKPIMQGLQAGYYALEIAKLAGYVAGGIPLLIAGKGLFKLLGANTIKNIEKKFHTFGNWAAKNTSVLNNTRNNLCSSICKQLDDSSAPGKAALNGQLTAILNSMLKDMHSALPRFMEQYSIAFAQNQREYDLKVQSAKESIRRNKAYSDEIMLHIQSIQDGF